MKLRSSHLGTAILAVLLALALAGVLAPAFGYRLDVVRSGSMEPAIGVGDLVVTSPCRPEDLRAGDVISFRSELGGLVCHRVVAVDLSNRTLITKGDANQHQDPGQVPFDDVVGRIGPNIPMMGHVVDFLKSPYGWALIILIAVLVIVLESGKPPSRTDPPAGEGGN